MDRELEQQLEALQKNFAGLAKTLGSSSKTLLKNSKDGETFGDLDLDTQERYWQRAKRELG